MGAMDVPLTRILVATDFSDVGNTAVPVAFALARSGSGHVRLAHVLEGTEIPTPLYGHYHPTPGPEKLAEMERSARESLLALVPEELRGVPHDVEIGRGSPREVLCRLAAEWKATLLVLSTRGHTGLKHLLLGSVAERVAQRAPCSVLLLR